VKFRKNYIKLLASNEIKEKEEGKKKKKEQKRKR
jgi:hypothetical protein